MRVKESKYWEEEEKKICRICEGKDKTCMGTVWKVRGGGRWLAEKYGMSAGREEGWRGLDEKSRERKTRRGGEGRSREKEKR